MRIKEVLRTPKPIHKDRFLGKIFLRVDSVILGVKIGGQMLKWDTSYPDSDNKKPVNLPLLAKKYEEVGDGMTNRAKRVLRQVRCDGIRG